MKRKVVAMMLLGVLCLSGCGASQTTDEGLFADEDISIDEDEMVEFDDEEEFDEEEEYDFVEISENKEGYYIQFDLYALAIKNLSINGNILDFGYVDTDFSSIDNLVYTDKCFKLAEGCVFTSESELGSVGYRDASYISSTIDSLNSDLDTMRKYGASRQKLNEYLSQFLVLFGHYENGYAIVDEVRLTQNASKWGTYNQTGLELVDPSSVPLDYYNIESNSDRTYFNEVSQSETRVKELLLMCQNSGKRLEDYIITDDEGLLVSENVIDYISYCGSWDEAYEVLMYNFFGEFGNNYNEVLDWYQKEGYPEINIEELDDYEIGKDKHAAALLKLGIDENVGTNEQPDTYDIDDEDDDYDDGLDEEVE